MDKLKGKRFACFSNAWSKLGDGSGLRTTKSMDIFMYMRKADIISEQWWQKALMRRESRDNLGRYMGKRKVLDKFFAKIVRDVEKFYPKSTLLLAYGSAGLTMKSSGKGECSVPTTDVYKSCVRIIGKQKVKVTNERNSTKIRWETGLEKDKVFRHVKYKNGELVSKLSHNRFCLRVPAANINAVVEYNTNLKNKLKRLRGGTTNPSEFRPPPTNLKYPEVRGLRFCTETRKYYNRDIEAATTIGRLYKESQSKRIPLCFSSKES
jgi:hypothetical protein